MKVYLLMCWCDGFGNDGFVCGIYSTYEAMVKRIEETSCRPKTDYRYFDVTVDDCENIDFDYYYGKEIE